MPKLEIFLERCEDLPAKDLFKNDPYVVIRVGKKFLRSAIKQNSCNPKYNEFFHFYIPDRSGIVEIEVWDKDVLTTDDLVGKGKFLLKSIPHEKKTPKTITLQKRKKFGGKVIFNVFITSQSCSHFPNCSLEIKGKCCKGYYGCTTCHNKKVKKWKPHVFSKLEKIKCLNCLLIQPLSKTCVSCEKQLAPYVCLRCNKVFSETNYQHCHNCKMCVKNPCTHKCFVFRRELSECSQLMRSIREDYIYNYGKRMLFKMYPKLYKEMLWLEIFYEKKLPQSFLIHCNYIMNTTNKIINANENISIQISNEILLINSSVVKLRAAMIVSMGTNINVKRRELYLQKRRLIKKISFLKKFKMVSMKKNEFKSNIMKVKFKKKDKKIQFVDNEEEEEGENEKDVLKSKKIDYVKWKCEKYFENEKIEDFYKLIDIVDNADRFLSSTMIESITKIIKDFPISKKFQNDFFMTSRSACFYYFVCKLLQLLYSSIADIKDFEKKGLKKEEKILSKYIEIFKFNEFEVYIIYLRALFSSFFNDNLYFDLLLYKLRAFSKFEFEKKKKFTFSDVIGTKELINNAFKSMKPSYTDLLRKNFYQFNRYIEVTEYLCNIYNTVIMGKKYNTKENMLSYITNLNYIEYSKSKFPKEKVKKNMKHVRIYKILNNICEYLRRLEEKGIVKIIKENYNDVDVIEEFSKLYKNNVKDYINELEKVIKIEDKYVTIDFYSVLIPVLFDIAKYLNISQDEINIYKLFHTSLLKTLKFQMNNELTKCIERVMKKEDYKSVSNDEKYSKYCKSFIDLLFQPIEMIYELDSLSRETKGKQRSVLLEYFVIMANICASYSSKLVKKVEELLDNLLDNNAKKNGVGFLEFFRNKNEKNELYEKRIDEYKYEKEFVLCNNIQGLLLLIRDAFLNSDFEEVFINSTEFNEEGGEEGKIEYVFDVVEIKLILDSIEKKRADAAVEFGEFILMSLFSYFECIFNDGLTKKERNIVIDEFFQKLDSRLIPLSKGLYFVFFKNVLNELYRLIVEETIRFIFDYKKYDLKDHSIAFMQRVYYYFFSDGVGVSKLYLNRFNRKFKKYCGLLDKSVDELKKICEEREGETICIYCLKIIQVKGDSKEREEADNVLVEDESVENMENAKERFEKDSELNERTECKLYVNVVRANNLMRSDRKSSDPFVTLEIIGGKTRKEKSKTKRINRSLNPVFNQSFYFKLDNVKKEMLKIVVIDYDVWGSNDLLGSTVVSFKDFPFGKMIDKEISLKKNNQKEKGTIFLQFKLL